MEKNLVAVLLIILVPPFLNATVHERFIFMPENALGDSGMIAAGKVGIQAASKIPSAATLADDLAKGTGGTLKQLDKGYEVLIPFGKRGINIRVMEERTNYMRVSIPGKETFTLEGKASIDQALTHIDITRTSFSDIMRLLSKIKGGT